MQPTDRTAPVRCWNNEVDKDALITSGRLLLSRSSCCPKMARLPLTIAREIKPRDKNNEMSAQFICGYVPPAFRHLLMRELEGCERYGKLNYYRPIIVRPSGRLSGRAEIRSLRCALLHSGLRDEQLFHHTSTSAVQPA